MPAVARLPVLLASLAVGCAQGDRATGEWDLTTTFDTVAGVVHVTNAGTAPAWRLVPVVSIGPTTLTDQAAPDEFGGVSAVALGPDETVFVADEYNSEVRVFGLDGTAIGARLAGRVTDRANSGVSIRSPGWATGCSPSIRAWVASANSRPRGSGSARERR